MPASQDKNQPFFIISPNSGAIEAACQVRDTWQAGGGDVRTYTAGDGLGNQAGASATVEVPKSQGSQLLRAA